MFARVFLFVVFLLVSAFTLVQAQQAEVLPPTPEVALARQAALAEAVEKGQPIRLEDLEGLGIQTLEGVHPFSSATITAIPGSERPYGIPPFFWGMVGSVPGAFAVYMLTRERRPTQHAIFGAVVGGVAIAVLYFGVLSN